MSLLKSLANSLEEEKEVEEKKKEKHAGAKHMQEKK